MLVRLPSATRQAAPPAAVGAAHTRQADTLRTQGQPRRPRTQTLSARACGRLIGRPARMHSLAFGRRPGDAWPGCLAQLPGPDPGTRSPPRVRMKLQHCAAGLPCTHTCPSRGRVAARAAAGGGCLAGSVPASAPPSRQWVRSEVSHARRPGHAPPPSRTGRKGKEAPPQRRATAPRQTRPDRHTRPRPPRPRTKAAERAAKNGPGACTLRTKLPTQRQQAQGCRPAHAAGRQLPVWLLPAQGRLVESTRVFEQTAGRGPARSFWTCGRGPRRALQQPKMPAAALAAGRAAAARAGCSHQLSPLATRSRLASSVQAGCSVSRACCHQGRAHHAAAPLHGGGGSVGGGRRCRCWWRAAGLLLTHSTCRGCLRPRRPPRWPPGARRGAAAWTCSRLPPLPARQGCACPRPCAP